MSAPAIHTSRDAAFWRVGIHPAQAPPAEIRRPETWASLQTARAAAAHISTATGWPIVDEAKLGR